MSMPAHAGRIKGDEDSTPWTSSGAGTATPPRTRSARVAPAEVSNPPSRESTRSIEVAALAPRARGRRTKPTTREERVASASDTCPLPSSTPSTYRSSRSRWMRRPLRPPGSSPARTIPRSASIDTIPETVDGASEVRRESSAWVRGPAVRSAEMMRCSLAARNDDCEPGPGSSRTDSIGEAMEQSHHKKRQDVNDPGSAIAPGHMLLVGSDQ